MRRAADVALWVGAVLGALSLVVAVLVAVLGLVPLIFTSGSMSPEIPSGSLGIARSVPAAELANDDVVSVESAEGVRVTHRIVAVQQNETGAVLTLKGDANSEPDAESYAVTAADRLLFSVPWVGHVMSALASPLVLFGAGVLAAGILFIVISSARAHPRPGGRRLSAGSDRGSQGDGTDRADSTRTSRLAAGVLLASLPALVVLQPVEPTTAAFSDTGGTVTTSGFVGHRVGQPISSTCSAGALALSLTVTTPRSDPRYTYWAQAFTAGASGTAISNPREMTGAGATASTTFGSLSDFIVQPISGQNYEVRVYARVAGTSWQSSEYSAQLFTRTLGLLACGAAPIAPTIGFTEPVDGASNNRGDTADRVSSICSNTHGSSTAAACGTVSDNGTITNVEYILQRTGFLLGTRCWDGGAWVTSCVYRAASRNTTTNPQRWSVPGSNSTYSLPLRLLSESYELTIRATDNDGRVTSRTVRYTATPL